MLQIAPGLDKSTFEDEVESTHIGEGEGNAIEGVLTQEEIENLRLPVKNPLGISVGESEEERMIPDMNSFQEISNELIMNCSAEREIYFQEVSSRVSEEFSNLMGDAVLQFLVSEEIVDVFVPKNWSGINGVPPLKLEFSDDMPTFIKPQNRKVPPTLLEVTQKEFNRMREYFYVPSTSSVASPLVVAKKSTAPFIRICGDYRVINKYVKPDNYPIPDVIKEIHKAASFPVFVDLDVRNAFHQILLEEKTSEMLSVQTQWGLYRPLLLPEGVNPASMALMRIMYEMFIDFYEWTIVIFDNILVLAKDYEDCFVKMKLVLRRCAERNVKLKLSKCTFGCRKVEFFGYVIENGTYRLSDERAQAITSDSISSVSSGCEENAEVPRCCYLLSSIYPNRKKG